MSSRVMSRAAAAILLTFLAWGFATQVEAASNPDYTAPPPTVVVVTPRPPAIVSPRVPVVEREVVETAVTSRPVRSEMPITGSDVTGLAIGGVALAAAGFGVLALRRRLSGSTLA